jgi:hypothetical protein
VGDRSSRSHHGPSRRSQTTPSHPLVDSTPTRPPTRHAQRHHRPPPPDPRRPPTTPQQRQPTTSDQQRRVISQLAQRRRRRPVPTAPQPHIDEEPSSARRTRARRKPRTLTSTGEPERASRARYDVPVKRSVGSTNSSFWRSVGHRRAATAMPICARCVPRVVVALARSSVRSGCLVVSDWWETSTIGSGSSWSAGGFCRDRSL